jgi:hypothetical protein
MRKSNAAAIAARECDDREHRLAVKRRADASLSESLSSIINSDESAIAKRELVRTSIDQYARFLKSFAEDQRGDGAVDADRENKVGEDDGDEDDDGERSTKGHRLDKLADLLVESGSHASRQEALTFLLHDRRGTAMATRHKREEKGHPMTVQEVIKKHGGVLAVCKNIAAGGDNAGLSESDIVEAATAEAKRLYPDLRSDSAFSRFYAENEVIRRACGVAKQAGFVASLPPLPR